MTRLRSLLVGVALLGAGLSLAAQAPADQAIPEATLKKLQKDLTTAVGDHFAFVRAQVVWDRHDHRFWLATLKAREPGEFVLRCGVKYEFPPAVKAFKKQKDGAKWTYRIAIGRAGAARVVEPRGYATAYPLACVGDEVVVPFRVLASDRDHRFEISKEPGTFTFLKETADRGWAMKADKKGFEIRNGVKETLKPAGTIAGSSPNRPLTAIHHRLIAAFDVIKDGKFTLGARLDRPQAKGAQRDEAISWALDIVAKGKPLTVTVPRWKTHEYRGFSNTYSSAGVPEDVVPVRVGDRLVLNCPGYVTPVKPAGAPIPQVEFAQKPFAAPQSPWKSKPGK